MTTGAEVGLSSLEYVRGLQTYLNAAIARGWMSSEQAISIWQTALIRQGRGDLITDLPYYEQAKKQIVVSRFEAARVAREPVLAIIEEARRMVERTPDTREKIKLLNRAIIEIMEQEGNYLALSTMRSGLQRSLDIAEGRRLIEEYPERFKEAQRIPGMFEDIPASQSVEEQFRSWIMRQPWFEEEKLKREKLAPYAPTPITYPIPTPRYEPAFEAERVRLAGTQPWRDWYESKFARELRRFRATLPRAERFPTEAEALAETERREVSWAEILRERKPELKEEWAGLGWRRRGERPGVFQPRIRTVKF